MVTPLAVPQPPAHGPGSALMHSGTVSMVPHARVAVANSVLLVRYIIPFAFMSQWNSFLVPLIFLNRSKNHTLVLGLTMFRDQFDVDWNATMIMSFLMVLLCLTIFFLGRSIAIAFKAFPPPTSRAEEQGAS